MANECTFEIGRIFVMRACENRIVRLDLYGSPCTCPVIEAIAGLEFEDDLRMEVLPGGFS